MDIIDRETMRDPLAYSSLEAMDGAHYKAPKRHGVLDPVVCVHCGTKNNLCSRVCYSCLDKIAERIERADPDRKKESQQVHE